jgi:hypothetical protein
MTASRVVRAGALALASVACVRPEAGTGTASSEPQAARAEERVASEEASAEPMEEPLAEAGAGGWGELQAALAALETPAPPGLTTSPLPVARDAPDEGWGAAVPRAEEPDDRHEEERLRAIGAEHRRRLRSLEGAVRYAEQAVRSAEAELDEARERPKLTHWPQPGPTTWIWCESEEPIVSPPPLNLEADRAAVIAAAEERLAQARDELKRTRDAEDDLLTTIRRERIPLGDVQ